MVMRLGQICAFLSSIHTNEKLKGMDLTIIISTTLSAIALIKRKKHINFTVSQLMIVSAITLGVNQGLSASLTTANQVLNLLLFDDLLYFVTGNDTDEPKFCNMRFDMDKKDRIAISHIWVVHALIVGIQMFGKRVATGRHTCDKSKGLIPTERVDWLNACTSRYAKVNILMVFSPFCLTKPMPPCISILKAIKRTV